MTDQENTDNKSKRDATKHYKIWSLIKSER